MIKSDIEVMESCQAVSKTSIFRMNPTLWPSKRIEIHLTRWILKDKSGFIDLSFLPTAPLLIANDKRKSIQSKQSFSILTSISKLGSNTSHKIRDHGWVKKCNSFLLWAIRTLMIDLCNLL